MENLENQQSVNNEEVAEPQNEEVSPETSENTQEVAEPVQDAETNAKYADMRRKQELEQTKQKAQELEQQTAYLERLAKLSGYQDTKDFLQAVDGLEEAQRVQQEAQKLGINEDAYRQYIDPTNQRVNQLESEVNQLRDVKLDLTLNDMGVNDKELRSQIKTLVKEKNYDPQDAYKILTYDSKIKETEQQVLAQVTGRDTKQVLPSHDKPNNTKFDPANMSLEDIEKISQRVRRGERITF